MACLLPLLMLLAQTHAQTAAPSSLAVLPLSHESQLPAARHWIGLASARKVPLVVVALGSDSFPPAGVRREVLNIEGVVWAHLHLGSDSHADKRTTAFKTARALARFGVVRPGECFLVLDPSHVLRQPKNRHGFAAFRDFPCNYSTSPVEFVSRHDRDSMWFLPVSSLDLHATEQRRPFAEAFGVFPRPSAERFNSLSSCPKHHILRSPVTIPRVSPSTTTTCLCLPLHKESRAFVNATIRSLVATTANSTTTSNILVLAAVEDTDPYLSRAENLALMRAQMHEVGFRPPQFAFAVRVFPFVEYDIVHLWNMLFLEAYEAGCEYLMHITSDVDFSTTAGVGPGWLDRFIRLLRDHDNLGAIRHSSDQNTMPFVHRTHLDIFLGRFYSRVPRNLYSDTSLWMIYRALGLLVGPSDLGHWVNLSDKLNTSERAKESYVNCDIRVRWWETPEWDDYSTSMVSTYLHEVNHSWVAHHGPITRAPTVHYRQFIKWWYALHPSANESPSSTPDPDTHPSAL